MDFGATSYFVKEIWCILMECAKIHATMKKVDLADGTPKNAILGEIGDIRKIPSALCLG